MDKLQLYENFINDIREVCLFHSIVINGHFHYYDDLIDVEYQIDCFNEKISPVKIVYTGAAESIKN